MNTRGTGGGGHWLRIEEKNPNPTIPEGKLDSRKPLEVESLLKELGKKKRGREVGGKDLSVFAISKL